MPHASRRLLACAALAGAALAPQAHAVTVIDFESELLTGLYFPGESSSHGGYTLTTLVDFGLIDNAGALSQFTAPTGNASQFYFNSNDGRLRLTSADATPFNLGGFDAAFVPLEPASVQTTAMVAVGTRVDDSTVTASWTFAINGNGTGAFTSYGSGLGGFTDLKQIDFYTCAFDGVVDCSVPTANNGQFAIDNIAVTAVPEPGTALLLTLGVVGLALRARRFAA